LLDTTGEIANGFQVIIMEIINRLGYYSNTCGFKKSIFSSITVFKKQTHG
jgi:hypothetical protein